VGNKEIKNHEDPYPGRPVFTSNWSERHVAWVSGLGTFGLSRGLITEKGVAGRLGSIVTNLCLEPGSRKYTGLTDYCTFCGACIRKCPAHAISKENGKEHQPCSDYLDRMEEMFSPRYACGKCQAGVPCESRIPVRK
jgi:epoxyqueuosine reductase QueG